MTDVRRRLDGGGAQVTDHDLGDEREPLLVRPFMLQDGEKPDADPSTQTWPSATTRVVRSTNAVDDAERTQIIRRLTSGRRRTGRHYRRRLLVVGGVGTAVIIVAAAAGFAALRPEVGPLVSAGPDGTALPAVTGPAPSGVAPGPAGAKPGPTATEKHRARLSPSAKAPTATSNAGRSTGPSATTTATSGTVQRNSRVVVAARTGRIGGQNGLCLDLAGDIAIDSNQVQVFTCNGSSAQTWTLATDGTLQVDGKCAVVAADNSVHITTCDDRTTAQWRVDGSTLINAADNGCLTDPSDGRQSGTAVTVSTCAGSPAQHWALP